MNSRLPPGQFAAQSWPVMDLGVRPKGRSPDWVFEVFDEDGNVLQSLTLQDLTAAPRQDTRVDLHGASTWSLLGLRIGGVRLRDVLDENLIPNGTRRMRFLGADGIVGSLPFTALDDEELFLVDQAEGRPLQRAHGGPVRLIAPSRYAVKSTKWLKALVFTSSDALDPRERRGVHPDADPWKEQRFA